MHASVVLLFLVYAAFVSLGLPDGAFGVGWPAMRSELRQPLEALGWVSSLWTACSAISGFASARVLARFGTLHVVLGSGLLTGFSLLGFALAPSFGVVVALALPLGLGAGSVDAGLNHHAAAHYSSRHMNWLHAAWGVGATLGPLALTVAIGSGHGWRAGYVWLAVAQLCLVGVFFATRRLWRSLPAASVAQSTSAHSARAAVAPSALWLAPATYVLYSGAEGGIGLWAASVLRDGRGFSPAVAGGIAATYFAAITLGRVLAGTSADRIGNRRMVRYGLALASAGLLLFALPLGSLGAVLGLALIGLGLAPIYPCLMHETPHRFDAATARRVIGRQVASAYLGSMLLPAGVGVLAGRFGLWLVAPLVGVFAIGLAVCVVLLDRGTPARARVELTPAIRHPP